jgi:hypothetical protein
LQAANIAHPILGSSSSPRHNLVRGSWPGFDRRNQGALPRPSSLSQPGSHGSDEAAQSATSNQPIRSSSEGKGRHGDSAGYESPLTAAIFRILAPDPTMPWEESRPMGRWEGSRAPVPGGAHCPDFTAIGGEVGSGRCSLVLRCRAILGNISGFRGFSTLQGDRPVLLC